MSEPERDLSALRPELGGSAGIRAVAAPDVEPAAVDDTDLAIIRALVEDARLSQRQLATLLKVSAPTVGERMARLERAGVIVRYTAEINWAALGYGLTVHLSINAENRFAVYDVMTELWKIPEIEDVSIVTGTLDLLVRLRVRDFTHMRSVLMDKVWEIPAIKTTTTSMTVAEMPAKNFPAGIVEDMISQRRAKRPTVDARGDGDLAEPPRRPN